MAIKTSACARVKEAGADQRCANNRCGRPDSILRCVHIDHGGDQGDTAVKDTRSV